MLQVNYDSVGKQKLIGIVCIVAGIFLGLISGIFFLGDEEGIGIFFGIICLGLIGLGSFKRKLSRNVNQYVNLINGGYTDIEEMSKNLTEKLQKL